MSLKKSLVEAGAALVLTASAYGSAGCGANPDQATTPEKSEFTFRSYLTPDVPVPVGVFTETRYDLHACVGKTVVFIDKSSQSPEDTAMACSARVEECRTIVKAHPEVDQHQGCLTTLAYLKENLANRLGVQICIEQNKRADQDCVRSERTKVIDDQTAQCDTLAQNPAIPVFQECLQQVEKCIGNRLEKKNWAENPCNN